MTGHSWPTAADVARYEEVFRTGGPEALRRLRDDEEVQRYRRDYGVESLQELAELAAKQSADRAIPAPDWRDLEEALTSLANEDNVARRLKALRETAGLSQEGLARKLAELGVQMPQSSISKIEVPVAEGRGKRRDITVDEAIALARALGVPLTGLLLPDRALADLELHRVLAHGPQLWQARNAAQDAYNRAVERLAGAAVQRAAWRRQLTAEYERLDFDDEEGRLRPRAPMSISEQTLRRWFLDDVVRRIEELDAERSAEGQSERNEEGDQ